MLLIFAMPFSSMLVNLLLDIIDLQKVLFMYGSLSALVTSIFDTLLVPTCTCLH